MLGNNQNRVAGKAGSAAAQGFSNGWIHLKAEFARTLRAEITFRLLIHIERDHLHIGFVPCAFKGITNQEAVANMLAVAQIPINGCDDGQAKRLVLRRLRGGRSRQRQKRGGGKELSS